MRIELLSCPLVQIKKNPNTIAEFCLPQKLSYCLNFTVLQLLPGNEIHFASLLNGPSKKLRNKRSPNKIG